MVQGHCSLLFCASSCFLRNSQVFFRFFWNLSSGSARHKETTVLDAIVWSLSLTTNPERLCKPVFSKKANYQGVCSSLHSSGSDCLCSNTIDSLRSLKSCSNTGSVLWQWQTNSWAIWPRWHTLNLLPLGREREREETNLTVFTSWWKLKRCCCCCFSSPISSFVATPDQKLKRF